jgi:hypothetical protein
MKVPTSPTGSHADLAGTLRMAASRRARRIRAERTAEGPPVRSDTQFAALAAPEPPAAMTPGDAMTPAELSEKERSVLRAAAPVLDELSQS